jgi:hypothetical protein
MAHVHVSVGDVIEIYGKGIYEIIEGNGMVALTEHTLDCEACHSNEQYGEGMPFCPSCINDAMAGAMLQYLISDGLGDLENVFTWDNKNAFDARNSHQQYVSVLDSAHDYFQGMDDAEIMEAFNRLVRSWVLPQIKERQGQ